MSELPSRNIRRVLLPGSVPGLGRVQKQVGTEDCQPQSVWNWKM